MPPATGEIQSLNPAKNNAPVFSLSYSLPAVSGAVESARRALRPWSALSQESRNQHLINLQTAFSKRETEIARAISLEMGKIYSESLTEAKSLGARIQLMIEHGLKRIQTESLPHLKAETRYHPQGVLAVIGPYNFPAHLINAHVIPALLTGNTVVVKPSEVCPWVGELYARCVQDAGLPQGVFNLVQGKGDVGNALVQHPQIDGVLFTGSYATGKHIMAALVEQPHKIAALEMGGKNIAVVMPDANLNQTVIEIIQGAFLTTGQRCTATSRVMVHRELADPLIEVLKRVTQQLAPGDPFDPKSPFGPLATQAAFSRFIATTKQLGSTCETLVENRLLDGGAFVTPSLRLLKAGVRDVPGYTDTELFGPDLCVEIVDDLDDAIERVNKSAFGLSNAIFTKDRANFEHFYNETRSGVLNWNRSTNGASGQLPFGGLGKSGNQRAAGIDAVRYTTFPVAINTLDYGQSEPVSQLAPFFASLPRIEALTPDNWQSYESTIHAIELDIYEAGRRDDVQFLRKWIEQPKSVGLVMIQNNEVVGYAIGGPLEFSEVDGPKQDPMRGQHNTFYAVNLTVRRDKHGQGLGKQLKLAQIERVKAFYPYMTGRHRLGHADTMGRIVQELGGEQIGKYTHQYGDPDGTAIYYRIRLTDSP